MSQPAAWRPPPAFPYRWMGPACWLALGAFLVWNAANLELDPARIQRGLARAGTVFARAFPPDFQRWRLLLEGITESVQMATLSTALGAALGIPVAILAARNVVPLPTYAVGRGIVSLGRTFHEIIVAIIMVKAVGFGPLAGTLTLTVNSLGFFSKLLAEQIEQIDRGQVEAVRATGAGRGELIFPLRLRLQPGHPPRHRHHRRGGRVGERLGPQENPVTAPPAAAPPVWTRFSRSQRAARLAARLAVALVLVWAARGMGVRWEWVADSPAQLADLFVRMVPPDWAFTGALVNPLVQTVNIATLGTAAAVLLALPVAFLAALNTTFNRGTYLLARLLIVVSRSVDSLIWALIFIIIVGPGSLAGALAVGVRSLGFVAKLFAEGIEEIDRGQVEAVTATGAGRFHVLLYGIVPQIRPVFAGVCMFRWDINIRESTVLGIVGAGGIGFVLNEAILGLEWARVSLILLVILGVVALSEVASAWIRRRLA